MAMVLAIGLVVDDAIVVLESVHRNRELGMKPFEAAYKGIREISFAIVAMTLTLVAVYAPVSLASGRIGKFLVEFSITLAGAVLLSGFAALTLSPMMCARLLGDDDHEKKENLNKNNFSSWDKFKDYLNECLENWKNGKTYAPVAVVIQSSGHGKTRCFKEFSKQNFSTYITLKNK